VEPWRQNGHEGNKVTINSPETIAALEYAAELYKTFIPGTGSWLDTNNNRAFLAGEISLTGNSVSIHYVARNDPKLADIAKDIRTVSLPIGPIGKPVELHQTVPVVIFKYTNSRTLRWLICNSCSRSRK
jgi:multiple sugar transport system substrate-binding protein